MGRAIFSPMIGAALAASLLIAGCSSDNDPVASGKEAGVDASQVDAVAGQDANGDATAGVSDAAGEGAGGDMSVGDSGAGDTGEGDSGGGDTGLPADTGPTGVIYYVRIDGNDSCSGLVDQGGSSGDCAWRTLQHAADSVQAGETVIVGDGTYQGFMIEAHGEVGSPIVFRAQSSGGAKITTPNDNTNDGINIESWGTDPADYVTIDGFTVFAQPRMGIRAIAGRGIIIQNCTVHGNSNCGIFSGDTPAIQVLNNTTYANGDTGFEHNIYISNAGSDDCVVRGNIVYSAGGGNGIQLNGDWQSGGDGFIDRAVVENNTVYDNHAKGLSLISIRDGYIRNNVVYHNGSSAGGIHIVEQEGSNYSSGNVVVNNTIDEPSIACVRVNAGNTDNVVFNNICIGNSGIVFEGTGNFESNNYGASTPGSSIFANAGASDYHLLATSPARDYGTPTFQSQAAPTSDFDSNTRPSGAGYDAGAFEFQ